ncbi:MAG: DUF3108 domain-containing protein [Pseudorhodobacter sp.]
MPPLARLTLILAIAFGPATAAFAQSNRIEDKATFDVILKGITAGRLVFSGAQEGNRYAVSGRLQSSGIAAMLRKFSYTAKANGAVSGSRYTPARYSEEADTGKRRGKSQIEYRRGVPAKVTTEPSRPSKVDPRTMGGTVDPLTSLYATLRDVDAGQECKSSVKIFDGRRATQITLSRPQKQGDRVVCSGEYRRLAGFSAKDMAEKTRFPFSLSYAPLGNGRMRVVEISTDTVYGKASMIRR